MLRLSRPLQCSFHFYSSPALHSSLRSLCVFVLSSTYLPFASFVLSPSFFLPLLSFSVPPLALEVYLHQFFLLFIYLSCSVCLVSSFFLLILSSVPPLALAVSLYLHSFFYLSIYLSIFLATSVFLLHSSLHVIPFPSFPSFIRCSTATEEAVAISVSVPLCFVVSFIRVIVSRGSLQRVSRSEAKNKSFSSGTVLLASPEDGNNLGCYAAPMFPRRLRESHLPL